MTRAACSFRLVVSPLRSARTYDRTRDWRRAWRQRRQSGARAARSTAAPRRRKRKLSKAGVRLIAGFEGFRSDLYDDAAGHCTIGYGHLVHTGNCDGSESAEFRKGVTREHALEILGEDAASAAAAVNDAVKVPLEQDQFDALTSFVFNVGSGAFRESTLLKLLNEGKYDEVPAQLDRWVKAGSRTLAGLVTRRKAEGELFARGTVQPADDGAMTTRDVQRALKELGWPLKVDGAWGQDTFAAVEDFQRGFAFWKLLVDGHAGAKTQEALKASVDQGGKCSPNFVLQGVQVERQRLDQGEPRAHPRSRGLPRARGQAGLRRLGLPRPAEEREHPRGGEELAAHVRERCRSRARSSPQPRSRR